MKFTRSDYNRRITDLENRIPKDEPCFLLRGQDKYAPSTLRAYARMVEEDGNSDMANELFEQARRMIVWQKSVKVKVPDKPEETI